MEGLEWRRTAAYFPRLLGFALNLRRFDAHPDISRY
jgi:hypothetical protein